MLKTARENGCNILFTNNNDENEHVSSLHMIDAGDSPSDARYVVRNYVDIQGAEIYKSWNLAGIPQTLGSLEIGDFTPMPTVQRSYFPDGQESWELTILPPDPKL